MRETEAQNGYFFVFFLMFLLPLTASRGLDVISGALAAILGHETTLRMDTTRQTGEQIYTEL